MTNDDQLKKDLRHSAGRHAYKLISKIRQVCDVPASVEDSIRIEMEYATLDGFRITARHNEEENNYGNR